MVSYIMDAYIEEISKKISQLQAEFVYFQAIESGRPVYLFTLDDVNDLLVMTRVEGRNSTFVNYDAISSVTVKVWYKE